MEKIIEELKNKIENDNFNISDNKSQLFALFRKCIQESQYTFYIGHYFFNIEPNKLLVSYETDTTYIETSNDDYYEETAICGPIQYYVISDNKKNIYSSNEPVIRINEQVLNIGGLYTDNYLLEICNNSILNINDYIIEDSKVTINNNKALISIDINKSTKKINIEKYLKLDKLHHVLYNKYSNIFENNDNNILDDNYYKKMLPNITKEKQNVNKLYKSLIEFYKRYI